MFNQVTLIGNLGRDPESRQVGETTVCSFTMATTNRRKDKNGQTIDETQWHNITIWGKVGEIAQQYLKKGSKVLVQGSIKYSEYTDKEGVKRYRTDIVCTEMKMLDTKASSEQRTTAQEPAAQTPVDDDFPF